MKLHSNYAARATRAFCQTRDDMTITMCVNADHWYCLDAVDPPTGGTERIDAYEDSSGEPRPAFATSIIRRD